MARPTRDDGIVQDYELEPGMKVFTVVNKTILDSTGAYCVAGQQAALNKKEATHYHKLNLIQVALPEDFGEEKPDDAPKPAASAGSETPVAVGEAGGEGETEPAADGGGGRTSRRV